MSEKVEGSSNSLDLLKWLIVFALLGGLVYGYSAYAEVSVLYRALAAVAIVVISLGVAATTLKGKTFLSFAKEARVEVRKVVFPERQEVVRLTLVILAATTVVGLLLYLFDMLIVWAIGFMTGIGA